MSNKFLEKIEEITKNEVVDRHSYFQLKYFIIGKEPTIQSKLWRCVRELQSRKESINSLKNEIENGHDENDLLEIEIDELKENMENCKRINDLKTPKKIEIKIRKANRRLKMNEENLANLEKKIKYVEEEAEFIAQSFESIKEITKEELLPFDDFESQTSYWNEKLKQELNLRSLLGLTLDTELVKTVLSLKDGTPIKDQTVDLLENMQKNLFKNNRSLILKEHKDE